MIDWTELGILSDSEADEFKLRGETCLLQKLVSLFASELVLLPVKEGCSDCCALGSGLSAADSL